MDLRTRTTLVCGAVALAIALSAVLRGRVRTVHWLFAAFSADIGLWYLSQSLFGLYEVPIWDRLRVVLAVLLPVFAVHLFQGMVPTDEDDQAPGRRHERVSLVLALVMLVLVLSPLLELAITRVVLFLYVVTMIAWGLYELGQRGQRSRSRATQKRVRFLVVTGALAGLFTAADFAWVIGYKPEYSPPPVGVVLSVVFLFMLAQALRHDRLFDLYEMLGRLLVSVAVAFLIAFVFYLLVTVVGQFNNMWMNAVLVATVVLVLFNPLRDWVEQQIQRLVFRERGKLDAVIAEARRRLAHTLEVDEMAVEVTRALERSRRVTTAALYLRLEDGTGFECAEMLGKSVPAHIDFATLTPLLEQLGEGSVVLEEVERAQRESSSAHGQALLASAEVLGELRRGVVVGVRTDDDELVGLLVVCDDRIRDAFAPDDVTLLDALATQIGVVVQNSRVYTKMKELDRLAVLGQMAAGLAHEIRNPLGAIKGAAQLLAEPAPGSPHLDAASQEFLGIIVEEVDRLDRVVGSMLDLGRQHTDVVAPIDVNAVVRRTLQVLSAEPTPAGVGVELTLADDLPRAAIAPEQLHQVLMNLLRNAKHAVGARGRIDVETRVREGPRRQVDIAVRDSGPGISSSALPNIFLPFFTTKEGGTGLGLAISHRIVQSAGGRIDVRSRPGHGATFVITLPAAMEALGTPTPSAAASPEPALEPS